MEAVFHHCFSAVFPPITHTLGGGTDCNRRSSHGVAGEYTAPFVSHSTGGSCESCHQLNPNSSQVLLSPIIDTTNAHCSPPPTTTTFTATAPASYHQSTCVCPRCHPPLLLPHIPVSVEMLHPSVHVCPFIPWPEIATIAAQRFATHLSRLHLKE